MSLLLSVPPDLSTSAAASRKEQKAAAKQETPHVSVVIVNYCQWENTAGLVQQICDSPDTKAGRIEVVVVDNHSPPSRLMERLRRRAGVSLRRWGRNRGFARAVNEGCRLSQGDWLLLLNPDVSVNNAFLEGVLRLCVDLEKNSRTGIVGFQLHNSDGSPQLSWGPFPSLLGTLARLLLPRQQRKYASSISEKTRMPVPWVTGCCLLVRRACLEELSGLDDQFFLYYEDVDLCRRARAHGWQVCFEPNLRAIHHSPLHSRKVPAILRLVTRHSLLTYARQHWPRWQSRLLAGIIRCEARVRRWCANVRGDGRAATIFAELSALAAGFQHSRSDAVRECLTRVLRDHESELVDFASADQAPMRTT